MTSTTKYTAEQIYSAKIQFAAANSSSNILAENLLRYKMFTLKEDAKDFNIKHPARITKSALVKLIVDVIVEIVKQNDNNTIEAEYVEKQEQPLALPAKMSNIQNTLVNNGQNSKSEAIEQTQEQTEDNNQQQNTQEPAESVDIEKQTQKEQRRKAAIEKFVKEHTFTMGSLFLTCSHKGKKQTFKFNVEATPLHYANTGTKRMRDTRLLHGLYIFNLIDEKSRPVAAYAMKSDEFEINNFYFSCSPCNEVGSRKVHGKSLEKVFKKNFPGIIERFKKTVDLGRKQAKKEKRRIAAVEKVVRDHTFTVGNFSITLLKNGKQTFDFTVIAKPYHNNDFDTKSMRASRKENGTYIFNIADSDTRIIAEYCPKSDDLTFESDFLDSPCNKAKNSYWNFTGEILQRIFREHLSEFHANYKNALHGNKKPTSDKPAAAHEENNKQKTKAKKPAQNLLTFITINTCKTREEIYYILKTAKKAELVDFVKSFGINLTGYKGLNTVEKIAKFCAAKIMTIIARNNATESTTKPQNEHRRSLR